MEKHCTVNSLLPYFSDSFCVFVCSKWILVFPLKYSMIPFLKLIVHQRCPLWLPFSDQENWPPARQVVPSRKYQYLLFPSETGLIDRLSKMFPSINPDPVL